jgi:ribosomal protein S8E
VTIDEKAKKSKTIKMKDPRRFKLEKKSTNTSIYERARNVHKARAVSKTVKARKMSCMVQNQSAACLKSYTDILDEKVQSQ